MNGRPGVRNLRDVLSKHRAPDMHDLLTGGALGRSQPSDQLGPGATAPLVRQIFPPWVYKLPTSSDFNAQDFATILAAGAGAQVTAAGWTFRLPATNVGYVQIFGIYVLNQTAATSIAWSLRINESPVPGWSNIQNPPGTANIFVQNYSELQVRVPNGAKVDVLAINQNAGGPWTIGAKINGWYHPLIEERRLYGEL